MTSALSSVRGAFVDLSSHPPRLAPLPVKPSGVLTGTFIRMGAELICEEIIAGINHYFCLPEGVCPGVRRLRKVSFEVQTRRTVPNFWTVALVEERKKAG